MIKIKTNTHKVKSILKKKNLIFFFYVICVHDFVTNLFTTHFDGYDKFFIFLFTRQTNKTDEFRNVSKA